MPVDVFICHSHQDEKIAKRLVDFLMAAVDLKDSEIRCTSDSGTALRTGVDIFDQLRKDIKNCRIFMPLITSISVKSQFAAFEIGAAWALKITIFPVVVDATRNLKIPPVLNSLQYCDCSKREGLKKLAEDVARHIYVKRDLPSETQILGAVNTAMASVEDTAGAPRGATREGSEGVKKLIPHRRK